MAIFEESTHEPSALAPLHADFRAAPISPGGRIRIQSRLIFCESGILDSHG
jgi:hypothetical protein